MNRLHVSQSFNRDPGGLRRNSSSFPCRPQIQTIALRSWAGRRMPYGPFPLLSRVQLAHAQKFHANPEPRHTRHFSVDMFSGFHESLAAFPSGLDGWREGRVLWRAQLLLTTAAGLFIAWPAFNPWFALPVFAAAVGLRSLDQAVRGASSGMGVASTIGLTIGRRMVGYSFTGGAIIGSLFLHPGLSVALTGWTISKKWMLLEHDRLPTWAQYLRGRHEEILPFVQEIYKVSGIFERHLENAARAGQSVRGDAPNSEWHRSLDLLLQSHDLLSKIYMDSYWSGRAVLYPEEQQNILEQLREIRLSSEQ